MILLAGSDVYFATDHTDNTPPEISIDGRTYYRFMDFIYIPVATEHLTPEQIIVVNTLRHRYRRRISLAANEYVRGVIRRVAADRRPRNLLEVGAGFFPLADASFAPQYTCADLNPAVVSALQGRGYNAVIFGADDRLPLDSQTVDAAVALFVFQFAVSDAQFRELARVIRPHGILIGNVYRRTPDSRSALSDQFVQAGFTLTTVPDVNTACKGQEFWVGSFDARESDSAVNSLVSAMREST